MSEAEKIVRAVWERRVTEYTVADCAMLSEFPEIYDDNDMKKWPKTYEAAWDAALAFTRDHMRKIAQKVRQVSLMRDVLPTIGDTGLRIWEAERLAILANLEFDLAVLRCGVREEYRDGRMEGL